MCRARVYCVCSRCELGLFGDFFLSVIISFLSPFLLDGWIKCDFTFFSAKFRSYQDDGWVMDDYRQWNHVYD